MAYNQILKFNKSLSLEEESSLNSINSISICTKNESLQPLSGTVFPNPTKKLRVQQASQIIIYVAQKLNYYNTDGDSPDSSSSNNNSDINLNYNNSMIDTEDDQKSPIILIFGSMLKEYRNGTSPCVQLDPRDKDTDVAVFEKDFYRVMEMADDIERIFGWKMFLPQKGERLFLSFYSQGGPKLKYQVDFYGFKLNYPKEGLLHFPWDVVTWEMDTFLPVVKHKSMAYYESFEEEEESNNNNNNNSTWMKNKEEISKLLYYTAKV